VKLTAQSDVLPGSHFVKYWRWVDAGSGDDLVVSDADGNEIAVSKANTDNYCETIPYLEQVKDAVVTTLDAGTLYVCIG